MIDVWWTHFIDWLKLKATVATSTSYSPAVLLHLRSVASGRHVVAKQTAEIINAYGLRRPRRRRGCRAGRRAKPRPPAATSALDQSANYLAAAASRPCSSTISSATTTTTITTDDSAQSSVNNQLIAKQSVNTLPSILGKDCTIWTPTKTYEIGQNRVKLAE